MTKQKCERFILVRESDGAKVMDLWLGLELSVNPAFAEAGIKTSLTNALKKWLEHEEKGGVSFGSIPSLARRSAEKMPTMWMKES